MMTFLQLFLQVSIRLLQQRVYALFTFDNFGGNTRNCYTLLFVVT